MIRYENVGGSFLRTAEEVREVYFPELLNVKIKFLFDTKKRMHGGKIVLGKCFKTNDLIQYFTIEEADDIEGYQYVIFVDKVAFTNIEKKDQVRLLRHELRHAEICPEAKNPYKIAPHDIEDFHQEVELNQDDVDWANRVASLTAAIYEQQEDQEKDNG